MSGHKLRILSSENDASVKVQQDQNTNITLKLEHTPSQADLKDSAAVLNSTPPYAPPGFTPGAPIPTPIPQPAYGQPDYVSPSAAPTASQFIAPEPGTVSYGNVVTRDIGLAAPSAIDLTADIADKDAQIEVLEALLSCYENNPLIVNKYVVCKYDTLMTIIKTLTGGDKVEFTLDEDRSCTCCSSKFIYISKIFVTKDGKSQEFKHAYNEKYSLLQRHGISLLQRHGISLKICTR